MEDQKRAERTAVKWILGIWVVRMGGPVIRSEQCQVVGFGIGSSVTIVPVVRHTFVLF